MKYNDPIQKAFADKMKKAGVTTKAIILESAAGEVIKVDPISAAFVRMGQPKGLKEENIEFLGEEALMEDRIDFLKNQYRDKLSTKHDPDAEHTNSDDIINHLSEGGDPTKKKIYSQWLVNQYRNSSLTPEEAAARGVSKIPHFKQEDVSRSHRVLGNFDKYKSKLDKKDINQYADLDEVQTAVEPHLGTATSKKDAAKNLNHPGLSKEWEDEHINLYHLKTKEASKELFGGGSDAGKTDWCTADTRDQYNAFDNYTKGGHRLWVVQHKPTGKLFQYQVKSAQFMNAKDEPASNNMEEYNSIIPSLHKAWKENEKFIDGDIEDDGHH